MTSLNVTSLDIKWESNLNSLDNKIFHILRELVQSGSNAIVESTARSILALLPQDDQHSYEIWVFGTVCVEVAEQIPYMYPSHFRLAGLIEFLGGSTFFVTKLASKDGKTSRINRFQRLGGYLRDQLGGYDEENPHECINYAAFLAHLEDRRIFGTSPTWAIRALREAFEDYQESLWMEDLHVLIAAQWILWYGQSLFKQFLTLGQASPDDLMAWAPGPLYEEGRQVLSLDRWRFWRDRFHAVASGKNDKEGANRLFSRLRLCGSDPKSVALSEKVGRDMGLHEECQKVAGKAADIMDVAEKSMSF